MTDDFREQVYATLNLKETDELVEIWRTNNRMDWSDIAFESIQRILLERLDDLPPQDPPIYEEVEEDIEDASDEDDLDELTEDRDIDGLINILENGSDPMKRLNAANALAYFGDERGLEYLISALKNPDQNVSFTAVAYLQELNDPKGNLALQPVFEEREDAPNPHRIGKIKTADLCDEYPDLIKVADPISLMSYGGRDAFFGRIETVKCREDSSLLRSMIQTDGRGKVLVVDGDGSLYYALLGADIVALAQKFGWAGIIVYGAIRDSEAISQIDIGVLALGTTPQKGRKNDRGNRNVEARFAGIDFIPGAFVYVDQDGIVASANELIPSKKE